MPSSQTGVPKISAAQPIGPITSTTAIRIENAAHHFGRTRSAERDDRHADEERDQRELAADEEHVADVVERPGGRGADAVLVDRRGEVARLDQHAEDGRRGSAGERQRRVGVRTALGVGEPRPQ